MPSTAPSSTTSTACSSASPPPPRTRSTATPTACSTWRPAVPTDAYGLDDAAKGAFAQFIAGKTLTANQLEFVDLIADHLTERGAMDPRLLYESPFTDLDPMGIGGLFSERDVEEVVSILDAVRKRAAA
jgi:hypothetical protein